MGDSLAPSLLISPEHLPNRLRFSPSLTPRDRDAKLSNRHGKNNKGLVASRLKSGLGIYRGISSGAVSEIETRQAMRHG